MQQQSSPQQSCFCVTMIDVAHGVSPQFPSPQVPRSRRCNSLRDGDSKNAMYHIAGLGGQASITTVACGYGAPASQHGTSGNGGNGMS